MGISRINFIRRGRSSYVSLQILLEIISVFFVVIFVFCFGGKIATTSSIPLVNIILFNTCMADQNEQDIKEESPFPIMSLELLFTNFYCLLIV